MTDEGQPTKQTPTEQQPPETKDTYEESTKIGLRQRFPDAEIGQVFLRDDFHGFKWRAAFLVLPEGHLPGQPIIGIWWDSNYIPKELRK